MWLSYQKITPLMATQTPAYSPRSTISERLLLKLFFVLLVVGQSGYAAVSLSPGDVVVSGYRSTGQYTHVSKVFVYSPQGLLKGELASTNGHIFLESFVTPSRDVYLAAGNGGIRRIDILGRETRVGNLGNAVHLAPSLKGDIFGSTVSGELFEIASDGRIVAFYYPYIGGIGVARGVDVASDQCTVYYMDANRLAKWNPCSNPTASTVFGPQHPDSLTGDLRQLPDHTFLVGSRSAVWHLSSEGRVIRSYPIPAEAIALDPDQTTFWAGAHGSLLRVELASGRILLNIGTGYAVEGLGVVGEPRAATSGVSIPLIPRALLPLLAAILAAAGLVGLRRG
jgi:hypothetical protein